MPWKDPAHKVAYMKEYNARPDQVAKRAARQAKQPSSVMRGYQKNWERNNPRNAMIVKGRSTAKARGIEFTLTEHDLHWPDYCPVLGIKLDYSTERGGRRANCPSFDRWDTTKTYVPGNVFVISWRANWLKSDATADELVAVAAYAVSKPAP